MPDEIRFTASYGGWNFEKRLPITETTSDSEVVRALSEIRNGISAKAFELTGIDIPGIKSLAKSESEGKAGAQALASLNAGKVRAKLRELCNEKALLPFAEALFNNELLRLLGIKTTAE